MPESLNEIKSTDSVQERDVVVLSPIIVFSKVVFLKDMPGCEGFYISRDIHEKKIPAIHHNKKIVRITYGI